MHTSLTLFLAALGAGQALAGLSHARFHQHRHARRNAPAAAGGPDWESLNWKGMFSNEQWAAYYSEGLQSSAAATAPVVAPTSAPASAPTAKLAAPATSAAPVTSAAAPVAAPAASPASSASGPGTSPVNVGSSLGSSLNGALSEALSVFDYIKPVANGNTKLQNIANPQTGTSDGTLGNYGAPNCMNLMQADSIDDQDFTITVNNQSGEDILLVWWNNSFGGIPNNGQCLASSTPCLTVPAAHGETIHVAHGPWTLGGFSIATKDTSSCGMFNQAMIEHHFSAQGSGYDYSSIPVTNGKLANMVVTSAESPCQSDQTQNSWKNINNDPSQPTQVGSGSCYIPGSTAHLTVTVNPF